MKKQLRLASIVTGLVVFTAACSSGGGATTAPSTAGESAAASAATESTAPSTSGALTGTLTIWEAYGASGSAEKTAFDKIVGNIKTANPGLTVTVTDVPFNNLFQNFETQAGTGGGPDMYIAPNDSLPTEARNGLLVDVSDLADTLKAAPYNTSDVAITASMVDGKMYEIPESMKAVELFYDKSVLTTAPATTDDWKANAGKLGWVYGANGGGAYYLWGIFSSFGGKILADDGKCAATANSGVADGLKWLQDMKAAGMKFYQNDNDAKADLISGKIAGFIDGPWQSGDLSKALGDKLAVAAGPSGPGGAWAPMTAPDGFYINASSANIDLAKKFALEFLKPDNEQIFADAGHLPANTTLKPSDPIAQAFAALMPSGFARPTAKELNNYWGNFGNALVAAIDKGDNPTTLVATACAAMDKANGK
ncbi:MAG TPA: extracellular solute-binding protein [Candidatus Limnocylindrales bacterium]|jgi:arabinogalactan oligomer/maltooligosaccharide transport system substrate-binding protein|nr:extracellular solute-binding protein [Candidatus Limnocylindrales bacterium]